jgi:hypothetical protein
MSTDGTATLPPSPDLSHAASPRTLLVRPAPLVRRRVLADNPGEFYLRPRAPIVPGHGGGPRRSRT